MSATSLPRNTTGYRHLIRQLQRMQFGRRSQELDPNQQNFVLEELEQIFCRLFEELIATSVILTPAYAVLVSGVPLRIAEAWAAKELIAESRAEERNCAQIAPDAGSERRFAMRDSIIRQLRRASIWRWSSTELGERAGSVFVSDESPEVYRRRLIQEIIARCPDAAPAYQIIVEAIEGISDPGIREHLRLHEVRYLMTYVLVPKGPGRLIDVFDTCASALESLKSWSIERITIPGFDFERDRMPFEDATVDGMLLCEVIEHFVIDPMFCLIEINRILRCGGFLILTTPNAASWFTIYQALRHQQPNRWAKYGVHEHQLHSIHAREYVPVEIKIILEAAGFGDIEIITNDYGVSPPYRPIPGFEQANRGETIFCRAYKRTGPRMRFVQPIYTEDKWYEQGSAP